jgi:simple sugar transport system ATP-binding protein
VRRAEARAYAARLIDRFDIRGAGPETRTRLLSGGNMQKVVLGKCLAAAPSVLLLNNPTRGVDIGVGTAVQN